MPDFQQTPLSPEQIVSYNQAFAASLTAIENAIAIQRNQILSTVISGLDAMIALGKKTTITEDLAKKAQAAVSQLQEAIEKVSSTSKAVDMEQESISRPVENAWYGAMMNALSDAQANAVSTQQNLDESSIAALTQLIATMIAVISAADAKSLAKQM
jgi:hypothetical protein